MPLFLITHSTIPLSILREFEKICRKFIWNNEDGSFGLHYVAWEELCKPKDRGGWGLQSAMSSLEPLRAKHAWNLVVNQDSMLNRNLLAKYGEDWWRKEDWRTRSPTWKIVKSGWKALKDVVRWMVVDGTKISVLRDT